MTMQNNLSMAENFQQFFSVQFATTNEQIKIAQHLRYRVYCEEFGYENSGGFTDQNETDEFDQQSTHCLIIHNTTQQAAGCVRVVPALSENEKNILPMEKYCGDALHPAYLRKLNQERATSCEISRLAVDRDFRRRSIKERESRFGRVTKIDLSPTEIRTLPLIAVSAFLAATAVTEVTGTTNGFAMMEPFLPKLMARSGICFKRAGLDIDYHGIRAPYFATTETALEGMQPELKELYYAIRAQLYPTLNSTRIPNSIRIH